MLYFFILFLYIFLLYFKIRQDFISLYRESWQQLQPNVGQSYHIKIRNNSKGANESIN